MRQHFYLRNIRRGLKVRRRCSWHIQRGFDRLWLRITSWIDSRFANINTSVAWSIVDKRSSRCVYFRDALRIARVSLRVHPSLPSYPSYCSSRLMRVGAVIGTGAVTRSGAGASGGVGAGAGTGAVAGSGPGDGGQIHVYLRSWWTPIRIYGKNQQYLWVVGTMRHRANNLFFLSLRSVAYCSHAHDVRKNKGVPRIGLAVMGYWWYAGWKNCSNDNGGQLP